MFIFAFAFATFADWTNWAIPTRIDVVRNDGFMAYGAFGNGSNCSIQDQFFVSVSHPQYRELYSLVLCAYNNGDKIQAYIHDCGHPGWYTSGITFNIVANYSVINVRK